MYSTITYSEVNIVKSYCPIKKNVTSDQNSQLERESVISRIFRELNRLRMTGTICNCVLATTDGSSFRVHKVVMAMCSDYFRTLFTTSLTDNGCGDRPRSREFYCIPNVSSTSLETIINFAYSGIVQVNEDNVSELLSVADQFNVEGIVKECTDFLLMKMTAENCIEIWIYGKEYFLLRLEKEALKYILEHFVDILFREEVLHLKVNHLKEILKDNALNVQDEFFVWIAIKRWCIHNYLERQKYIPDLFPSVRLALLSLNQFKQIMDDPRVLRYIQCRKYIKIVSKYISGNKHDLSIDVQDNRIASLFTPRYPYTVILSSGGSTITGPTNVFEVYDSRADLWKMITPLNFEPLAYHQIVRLRDHIYILGGSRGHDPLNSCWRSDVEILRFKEISPMHDQRALFTAVVIDGKIYAIGGFDGSTRLNTVEFYDVKRNQWTYVSSMNERRSDASASALRNRIFVVGGYNGTQFLKSAECYFAEFDQWFYLTQMINYRSGAGCVAMDDAVYAIGGYNGEKRLNSMEKYCFFQSQWFASKPMKQRRSNFAVEVLDKKIYVIGGYDDVSDTTLDQVECFDPANMEWRTVAALNIGRSGFSACTFSGLTRIAPYIKDNRFRCRFYNLSDATDRNERDEIFHERIRLALHTGENVFV